MNTDATWNQREVRTSISCDNIPNVFLDKLTAKAHFGQFGKIKRFILRPHRMSCTVEYEQQEVAKQALECGHQFNEEKLDIYWSEHQPSPIGNSDGGLASGRMDSNSTREGQSNIVKSGKKPLEQRVTSFSDKMVDPKITIARSELKMWANRSAKSSEERYRALETIDRLLRLTNERTTDIRNARNIEGTCPDMCPEKERYLREWKCMVPPYERQHVSGGSSIDHSKAIKQYSRSSADQELPLPHELRTQEALGRTMYYLLKTYADRCNVAPEEGGSNVSDWFHYIWDRTRGIRKDITQQDLCSPLVVELLQACTRFHIHCAARLASEDPSVFDQKINTENMTKCLQTLKYMYTDLRQRGEHCPDEPEFRGYMILLYLNDGNFLWELRQLPESIIHSSEVQFALNVYYALKERNYVRFFRLVRDAKYMTACILLRYFTQVRQTALEVLRKAYVLRSTTNFTVDRLTNLLGFEDELDAWGFFEHYGVAVDRQSGIVYVEGRQSEFNNPYPTGRAPRLVESKRIGSVGEAICGTPLGQWGAQFPPSRCLTSFDARGVLRDQVLDYVLGGRHHTLDMLEADEEDNEKDGEQEEEEGQLQDDEMQADEFDMATNYSTSQDDAHVFKVPSPAATLPRVERVQLHAQMPAQSSFSFPAPAPPVSFALAAATTRAHPEIPSSVAKKASYVYLPGDIEPFFEQNGIRLSSHLMVRCNSTPPENDDDNAGMTDSATTMEYARPPTNSSVTAAGQKRTYFGAAKPAPSVTVTSASLAKQQPQPRTSSITADQSFPSPIAVPGAWGGAGSGFPALSSCTPPEMERERKQREDRHNRKRAEVAEGEQRKREEREREEERVRERKLATVEGWSGDVLDRLTECVVADEVRDITEEVMAHQQNLQSFPCQLLQEMEESEINAYVMEIVRREVQQTLARRAAQHRQVKAKFFHAWVAYNRVTKRWNRLFAGLTPTPISFEKLPSYEQIGPVLRGAYMHGPVLRGAPSEYLPLESFPQCELIDPFAILDGAAGGLLCPRPEPPYWKLTISVPTECEHTEFGEAAGFAIFMERWLRRCAFQRCRERELEGHLCYYLEARMGCSVPPEQRAAICMRLVVGSAGVGTTCPQLGAACDRSNGLLLFFDARVPLAQVKRRLAAVLSQTVCPPAAIALVEYSPGGAHARVNHIELAEVASALGLDRETGAEWKLFVWGQVSSNAALRDAMAFLAECYQKQREEDADAAERLEMRWMHEFLDQCLGKDLWFRWQEYGSLESFAHDGNGIVALYNEAVSRVRAMTVGKELDVYARISADFDPVRVRLRSILQRTTLLQPLDETAFPPDWHVPERLSKVSKLLDRLELLPIPERLLRAIDNAAQGAAQVGLQLDNTELVEAFHSYLCGYIDKGAIGSLFIRERLFVEYVVIQLAGHCYPQDTLPAAEAGGSRPNPRRCYWVPLLVEISKVLRTAALQSREGPLDVCYAKDDFAAHTETDWWVQLPLYQEMLRATASEWKLPPVPTLVPIPNCRDIYLRHEFAKILAAPTAAAPSESSSDTSGSPTGASSPRKRSMANPGGPDEVLRHTQEEFDKWIEHGIACAAEVWQMKEKIVSNHEKILRQLGMK